MEQKIERMKLISLPIIDSGRLRRVEREKKGRRVGRSILNY